MIRLDKTVLGDSRLGKYIAQFGMQHSKFDTELVANAYQGVPATKQTARKIKACMAARMQDTCNWMGYTLNPADIRSLFDAVVKDLCGDADAIDTDIHDDNAVWRQAIKLERSGLGGLKPFWNIDLRRGISVGTKCHAELMRVAVVSDFDESATLPTCFTEAGKREATVSWLQRLRTRYQSTAQRLHAALHRD